MKRNFYATLLALSLSLPACEMDTFNEQDAIAAQKELMVLKYQNETELEKLRNAATTALEQLRYTNALEELRLNNELSRGAAAALETARQANALALESARQANALALQENANAAAVAAAKAKAETDAAAAAKAAEMAENARLIRARQDYSVAVTDVNSRTPLADAEVTVASEGKIVTAKTNAAGVASFNGLILFPSSRFSVTKAGFASASVLVQNLGTGPIGLLNTDNARNEVKGKLYIETDLTNVTAETAPGNILVTASADVPFGFGIGTYRIQVATRTDADGNYSLKLLDAPNGYTLDFEQVAADQKIYVNGTEDNGMTSNVGFPNSLPHTATIKTYFDVKNAFGIALPSTYPMANNRFYFKLPADLNGDVAYFSAGGVNTYYTGTPNDYRITNLYYYYYSNYGPFVPGGGTLKYAPNATLDAELVDWTGKYIIDAPKIVAYTNGNGDLSYQNQSFPANSTTGNTGTYSDGYLHFKKDAAGTATAAGAQGRFKIPANSYPNAYSQITGNNTFNYAYTPANSFVNYTVNPQGGQMVVRNFYYGQGSSREKGVF